jgi:GH25 family lysozyme M1 (1,4-beta-N-acetylmuramidase)
MRELRYMADVYEGNTVRSLIDYFNAGRTIIALKATEGQSHIDVHHAERARTAHGQGGTVLHYHFGRPDTGDSPWSEADAFIRAVRPTWVPGDYLALDIETATRDLTPADGVWCERFAHRCHETFGATPVVYANESTLQTTLARMKVPGERYWVAKYGPGQPSLPHGKRVWAWQFTDGQFGKTPHSAPGIGACDQSLLPLWVALPLRARTFRRRGVRSRKVR